MIECGRVRMREGDFLFYFSHFSPSTSSIFVTHFSPTMYKQLVLLVALLLLLLVHLHAARATFVDQPESASSEDMFNYLDKRLAPAKFASGLGKRLAPAKFASGLGKRLAHAKFASGLGKRLASAKFASGLGK